MIHRFGNEFWVEGDWTKSVGLSIREGLIRRDHDNPFDYEFQVGYSTHGERSAAEQRPYGQAIIAACDYADLLTHEFKGVPYMKVRELLLPQWDRELHEFYKGLYYEWNPKKKKKE